SAARSASKGRRRPLLALRAAGLRGHLGRLVLRLGLVFRLFQTGGVAGAAGGRVWGRGRRAPPDAPALLPGHLEAIRVEGDLVAVAQGGLAAHALAVDVGAVAAAQVGNRRLLAAHADEAVVPADGAVRQAQVAIGPAADQELVLGDGYFALLLG